VTRRRPATAEFDAGGGLADEGADEVGPEDGAGAAFDDDLDRFRAREGLGRAGR
jgi:hypothetical protein